MPETSILNAHVGKLTEQVKMSLKEIGMAIYCTVVTLRIHSACP